MTTIRAIFGKIKEGERVKLGILAVTRNPGRGFRRGMTGTVQAIHDTYYLGLFPEKEYTVLLDSSADEDFGTSEFARDELLIISKA